MTADPDHAAEPNDRTPGAPPPGPSKPGPSKPSPSKPGPGTPSPSQQVQWAAEVIAAQLAVRLRRGIAFSAAPAGPAAPTTAAARPHG